MFSHCILYVKHGEWLIGQKYRNFVKSLQDIACFTVFFKYISGQNILLTNTNKVKASLLKLVCQKALSRTTSFERVSSAMYNFFF